MRSRTEHGGIGSQKAHGRTGTKPLDHHPRTQQGNGDIGQKELHGRSTNTRRAHLRSTMRRGKLSCKDRQ
eukprot:5459527-Heterocapsa_arctica.AAC.1